MAGTDAKKAQAQGVAGPIISLVVICLVSGCLLGLVNAQTAPIIDEVKAERAEQTYATLVEGAASFEDIGYTREGCVAALEAKGASGETLAHIFVCQSKGYGGQVPVAVAFDADGNVMALSVMDNDETPGLGTRATTEDYLKQYVGRGAETLDVSDVDLVSGATITSKTVLSAVNVAIESFKEVSS